MTSKRRKIEIHIVMTESGAFVVDEDPNAAAEKAEEEFPDDDVRQVALTIELQPPSVVAEAAAFSVTID